MSALQSVEGQPATPRDHMILNQFGTNLTKSWLSIFYERGYLYTTSEPSEERIPVTELTFEDEHQIAKCCHGWIDGYPNAEEAALWGETIGAEMIAEAVTQWDVEPNSLVVFMNEVVEIFNEKHCEVVQKGVDIMSGNATMSDLMKMKFRKRLNQRIREQEAEEKAFEKLVSFFEGVANRCEDMSINMKNEWNGSDEYDDREEDTEEEAMDAYEAEDEAEQDNFEGWGEVDGSEGTYENEIEPEDEAEQMGTYEGGQDEVTQCSAFQDGEIIEISD